MTIEPMPEGTRWLQLFGAALLCGIGFTMSLFIGSLAFEDEAARLVWRAGSAFSPGR